MAQVYAFTDQNGETRLFAEIHPDPAGTPFNGGTIRTPLTIDYPVADNVLLINMHDGVNVSQIDNDGFAEITSNDGASLEINGAAGSAGAVQASGGVGGNDLAQIDSSAGLLYETIGGSAYFSATKTYVKFHQTTIPADGDLAAGDCALWFDQTNGAAKLMIKAKQADGTVRTGSLALT